ncbi:MAG TPA: MBL fold metallo-hydrolase [Polyangia bacterium]|jgi:L-ascorbate metabolism protein UlaG (beta-lactamase superfamily)|nr:MBL fold metallo-hydrolase [Polyangia bacterium]
MSMRRPLIGLAALAAVLTGAGRAPTLRAQPTGSPVVGKLTWFGQACFLLETAAGTRILMDPIPKGIGYPLPTGLKVDAVTVSHEHADHNNVALAGNRPKILRGLTPDKKGWIRIDEKVKEVAVRSIAVYHDADRGAQRGLDTVFLFEVAGMRIAHLGDLGHLLSDDQLSALGAVDVVLIPVGGAFTLDARQATRVVDQLHPRLLVIPMHFKTDAVTIKELAEVDPFLAGKPNVHRETGNTIPLKPLKGRPGTEIIVLDYK